MLNEINDFFVCVLFVFYFLLALFLSHKRAMPPESPRSFWKLDTHLVRFIRPIKHSLPSIPISNYKPAFAGLNEFYSLSTL